MFRFTLHNALACMMSVWASGAERWERRKDELWHDVIGDVFTPLRHRAPRHRSQKLSVNCLKFIIYNLAFHSCVDEASSAYLLTFFNARSWGCACSCNYGYGRPYCKDAPEGVGGITPLKLNRGWWNSATTKYFEGYVVCKNLGAIG